MWKSEGDSAEREAASAVRQGVLRGKRRLAAVAVGAFLGVAAIVAVYLAWRGGGIFGRNKCDPPGAGRGGIFGRNKCDPPGAWRGEIFGRNKCDPPEYTMINHKIDKWLNAIANRKSQIVNDVAGQCRKCPEQ